MMFVVFDNSYMYLGVDDIYCSVMAHTIQALWRVVPSMLQCIRIWQAKIQPQYLHCLLSPCQYMLLHV